MTKASSSQSAIAISKYLARSFRIQETHLTTSLSASLSFSLLPVRFFQASTEKDFFAPHLSDHHQYPIVHPIPLRRSCTFYGAILFTSRMRIIVLSYCEIADISISKV
jgi:hypothetical protein